MAEKNEAKEISELIALKKKFVNPNSVETIFANEMTASHTNREFFISFYRLEPYMVIDEEDKAALLEKENIDAVMVSRIVVTPDFAKAILKALQENIDKFDKAQKNDSGR